MDSKCDLECSQSTKKITLCLKYLIRKAILKFRISEYYANIYLDFFSTYKTETAKEGEEKLLENE